MLSSLKLISAKPFLRSRAQSSGIHANSSQTKKILGTLGAFWALWALTAQGALGH